MNSLNYKIQLALLSIIMLFITSTGAGVIICFIIGIPFLWVYSIMIGGLVFVSGTIKELLRLSNGK